MELLSTNVKSKVLREGPLLLYGTCVEVEAPEVFREFSGGQIPLSVCLEKEHMDKVGFKIATIIMTSDPKEMTVLTMDGSPHCLQLHLASEQAKRIAKSEVNIRHFVIEGGKSVEVSKDAVETARHLSRIQKLLEKRKSFCAKINFSRHEALL